MTVSVFMPSFNKPGYVSQAVRSVTAQSSSDWELWVLDNSTDAVTRQELRNFPEDPRIIIRYVDLSDEERQHKDPPVYLCNRYYPQANGDIIIYMSDDDLLSPGLIEIVNSAFRYHEDWDALYWNSLLCSVNSPDEIPVPSPWLGATATRGSGLLSCQIDGGQIAVRKLAFERLDKPWYPEDLALGQNRVSDGVLMEKLADSGVLFHPIRYDGLIHRQTPISTYTKA